MVIQISGLPGAGKSSFADAVTSLEDGYTHVPLDKYIREVPEEISFLDWVSLPECIDWLLLRTHFQRLNSGMACFTPAPDWRNRGKRKSDGGSESGGQLMKPAARGYLLPGCHAFQFREPQCTVFRVFIKTEHSILAQRLAGHPVEADRVEHTLDHHLSSNWREIEAYGDASDLTISGIDQPTLQVRKLLDTIKA